MNAAHHLFVCTSCRQRGEGKEPRELIECATLYRRAPIGFLPREQRPHALRGGILARVPPLETP